MGMEKPAGAGDQSARTAGSIVPKERLAHPPSSGNRLDTGHARDWPAVSRREPCPNCGKPDRCKVSPDGHRGYCFRIGATGAYYPIDGSTPPALSPPPPPKQAPSNRADSDTLNTVYQILLGALDLSDAHREQLRRRGFTDEQIERRGYRTLPADNRSELTRRVQEAAPDIPLGRVPGFYRDDSGHWTVAGLSGQLIPTRDRLGRIEAIKLRPDDPGPDPDRNKYRWLSSSAKRDGTSSGAPIHVAWPAELRTTQVYITEGHYKADYSSDALGAIVISVPGVSNWRPVLPVLEELDVDDVVVAYDAELLTNPNVLRNRDLLADALAAAGYTVTVADWDPTDGKGIDDLLAAGGTFAQADWVRVDALETAIQRAEGYKAIILGIRHAIAKPDALDGEKLAAIVSAFEIPAELSRRPTEASCRISRGRIAEGMGKSVQSAGDGLKRLENRFGLITRSRQRHYDDNGGGPSHVYDELRIETPYRTPAAFLEAFAEAEPAEKINRGGKRIPKCPDCGDVGTVTRKIVACAGCGQVLADEKTHQDPEPSESQLDSPCTDVSLQRQLDSTAAVPTVVTDPPKHQDAAVPLFPAMADPTGQVDPQTDGIPSVFAQAFIEPPASTNPPPAVETCGMSDCARPAGRFGLCRVHVRPRAQWDDAEAEELAGGGP